MNKKEVLKCLSNPPYEMITLDTSVLIIPRDTYQRPLQSDEVKEIIAQFSPYLLNEPKVSFRNGKYYVFDGQHTIISLLEMNEGKHIAIRCKVYYGMTEQEEAKLFSMQTGAGRKLSPADKIRAELHAQDMETMNFRDVSTLQEPNMSEWEKRFTPRHLTLWLKHGWVAARRSKPTYLKRWWHLLKNTAVNTAVRG